MMLFEIFLLYLISISNINANVLQPENDTLIGNASLSENFFVFLHNKPPYMSPIQISNEPGDFYTHLNEKLVFKEQYEVALRRICIDTNWKNLPDEQIIEISNKDHIIIDKEALILNSKNYEKIDELITDLNKLMEEYKDIYNFYIIPEFSVDYRSRRVQIRSGICKNGDIHEECFPVLSQELSEMLGFVDQKNEKFSSKLYYEFLISNTVRRTDETDRYEKAINKVISRVTLPFTFDFLKIGIPKSNPIISNPNPDYYTYNTFEALQNHKIKRPKYLNIQTNIIDDFLGENPIERNLRAIEVPSVYNHGTIQESFDSPEFHRVNAKEIQEILLRIKDQNGHLIKFDNNSIVWSVLEFRKF